MFIVKSQGEFKDTKTFLKAMIDRKAFANVEALAKAGVAALASATPRDTGNAAGSWSYVLERNAGKWTISWTNNDMIGSTPLVILLQYGHGTGTGGYVAGRDFINPAIRPIMDRISKQIEQEVRSL